MQIIEVEQNTPEWLQARSGIPTMSEASTIMMESGPRGGIPLGRQTYIRKLAGEVITGKPATSFTTAAMERGHMMEPEARELYSFATGHELTQVGFIRSEAGICGARGASPDSLVGDDGGCEIKTAEPHILIGLIEKRIKDPTWFPPEHYDQCQGNIWVSERKWWDLVVYWPGMPLFIARTKRDDGHIAKIDSAVLRFNMELAQLVKRIKDWGGLV